MNRRRLFFAAAVALLAGCERSTDPGGRVEYDRTAYERALASGEPLLLDFYAPW